MTATEPNPQEPQPVDPDQPQPVNPDQPQPGEPVEDDNESDTER